jgi:hypothetical protein
MNSIPGYMFCIPMNQLVCADSISYRKRVGEEIRIGWVLFLPSGRKNLVPPVLRIFLPVSPPVFPPVPVPLGKRKVTWSFMC